MLAPIIWGLIALGMAACASSSTSQTVRWRRDEEDEGGRPSSPPIGTPSNDPCPDEAICACAEGTGWVSGEPRYSDNFVQIGSKVIDKTKNLHTVKYSPPAIRYDPRLKTYAMVYYEKQGMFTYFPMVDFQFKLGSAEPLKPGEFQNQTSYLTEELLKVLIGKYSCHSHRITGDPVIYVAGHTDRLAEESYNIQLSQGRALKVADGIMHWLQIHAHSFIQPVTLKYVGLGEKEAREKGDTDETPNEKRRRVDVMMTSTGEPFQAGWQILGRVEPSVSTPSEPSPPIPSPPIQNSLWRNFTDASVQREIQKACKQKQPSTIQECIESVGDSLFQTAQAICARGAVWDNVPVETCQSSLLGFPWNTLQQLNSKYGDKMPALIELMKADRIFSLSLKSYISTQAANDNIPKR